MQRLVAKIALVALAVVATAGCQLTLFPTPGPGGGGNPPNCLVGSWTFQTELIQSPITTPFGTITINTSGPGTTLTFGSDGTWQLATDTTLTASIKSQFGTVGGTVEIVGNASGTFTNDATTITFTLGSVTGSATYNVNLFGQTFSGTLSLPTSGLQNLVGLSGTAAYTCSSSALNFTLKPMQVQAIHK
jgi:hypothetical protein